MRLKIVFSIMVVVWITLISRVYYLSIKASDYYTDIAKSNAIKTNYLPPVRGQIMDSTGNALAINRLGFSIFLAPHLKASDLDTEVKYLSNLFIDINATEVEKTYKRNNSLYNQDFIEVVDFLNYDDVVPHFSELNLRDNLKVESKSIRFYPYNDLASHIIGYVGKANAKDMENNPLSKLTNKIGKSGVESYYNEELQGERGARKTKVTALNKVVEEIFYEKPTSKDIELHINMELQKFLKELFKDKAGAVVIMDVNTGAIIGAGSYPEYELNPFVTGISSKEWRELIEDLDHPFTNKLINGLYPPGSVIKMGVGMSFLNSGLITKEQEYRCGGYIELGGRKFRCWKTWGHGKINLNDAIRESCDVYFYEGSLVVGIDYISANLQKYGLGKKTGIDLPNEFIGVVPNKAWKMEKYNQPWYMGETVITSIGQGNFLVTPMQIAKYTAELASGKGLTPHFIRKIDGKDVEFKTTEIFNAFEKEQLPYIRKAMFEVAHHQKGTASKYFKGIPINIGAKTGTAQVVGIPQSELVRMKEKDMEYYHRSHAWLTSFGPYENPKYAVTVLVEHGGGGSSAGSPIVKKIYEKLIEMGYIDIPNTSNKK
ncbi:penicillin-binding protein 2 [Campylobacter blaseri]|uniref:Penicillin-binding protein 2 n=1 Tax=Campylobacter blaseri TaxID=2042961 RepID=A0A2P8R002_9BACT|nr:penicillin-binding protein 2 [Campylobacter blaseri]PSM51824.1 penicillin-binding protein 2 [Campylobacter blaseri]PSM53615.1 penicillin-binding protein 2 [Campylobacter blaseri]QKF86428.1 penicillin-binding protein 2 [Campylobacter blaseri]